MKIFGISLITAMVTLCYSSVSYPETKLVKQTKWSEMLVGALPFESSPDAKKYAPEKFTQLLEGIPDRTIQIDQFKAAINNPQIVPAGEGGAFAITSVEPSATVFFFLVVPAKGEVAMDGSIKGGSQYWTFGNEPTIISKYQVVLNKVNIGRVKFSRGGVKRLGISIPKDGLLSSVDIDAACRPPISPEKGWEGGKTLLNRDMARTIVQALGWGNKLPLRDAYLPTVIKSKKVSKPKGGLAGFDFEYEKFSLKEGGFYSFFTANPRNVDQIFLIDGCIEKKIFAAELDKIRANKGELFTIYLKTGAHSLKINWNLDKDPGDIILKKRDSSFDEEKKLLEGNKFLLGGSDDPVDENTASANIGVLIGNQGEAFEGFIPFILPGQEDQEIKQRSLSPVLPAE